MKTRRSAQTVNSGSMADIAFLLLIFFLVTTTISSDTGINRKLPRLCPPGENCNIDIHERNILRIQMNAKNEIMINEKITSISNLKQQAKDFIDNNGDSSCDYCHGLKLKDASDNPTKAVVSLQSHPLTSYDLFIKVQDELTKAYLDLRTQYARTRFNKTIDDLTKEELQLVKIAYPFIISEAQTK